MSDFSIKQKVLDHHLAKGEPIIFLDENIPQYLIKKLKRMNEDFSCKSIAEKIILISNNTGAHLVTGQDYYNSYHAVIAEAYSMLNNKCVVNICGGSKMRVISKDNTYIFEIGGDFRNQSQSFEIMNSNHLKEAIKKLGVPVELKGIFEEDVKTTKEFLDYSYEEINYMTKNIGN